MNGLNLNLIHILLTGLIVGIMLVFFGAGVKNVERLKRRNITNIKHTSYCGGGIGRRL